MTDFGTPEERAAALRFALACRELNRAISAAAAVGVNCRVMEINSDIDDPSILTIQRMERRTSIVPEELETYHEIPVRN